MLHSKEDNKDTHGYSNVAHEMQEDVFHNEEEEDDDAFAAWPTQKNDTKLSVSTNQSDSPKIREMKTNKNQSTDPDSPSKEKRPVLIGNLDEETLPKKQDVNKKALEP